jgi:murein DD-endopeptidase MepM/ murein hydrolase activator NlpD
VTISGEPISERQLCASKPAQGRHAPTPGGFRARAILAVRARIASLLVVTGLLAGIAPVAQAAAPSAPATASSGGGVSASDTPPPPAANGGSQSGKVPARQTRVTLARAARTLGSHSLRRGSRGREVRTLQLVLSEVGYRARPTGFFGLGTEYQVKRFQRTWHIPVIGIVGPATGAALRSALQGGRPMVAPAVAPPAPVSAAGWAYPVRGPHNYGNADNVYGAPRSGHSHAGQDVMSPCGTPLAAARGGTVLGADYGGAAGNYVAVHTADTRYDYFYAHLRVPALVKQGATVQTGQIIGYVGDTGDAVGCHLHFELWDGGWWNGGHTVDPLPFLKAWEQR